MQVRALLNAPLKSRFEEFDISVREAIYKSQQNEQLGMPRKPWAKPDNVTNFSRTFGDPSGSGEYIFFNVTLFYRINTKINSGSYQIQKFTRSFYLRMCQRVSKMSGEPVPFQSAVISMTKLNNVIIIVLIYICSSSGYNDAFNHEHTFGDYYHPTYDGRCAKMCLNWLYRPSDLCVISKIQGEVRDRTWAPDGMVLEP